MCKGLWVSKVCGLQRAGGSVSQQSCSSFCHHRQLPVGRTATFPGELPGPPCTSLPGQKVPFYQNNAVPGHRAGSQHSLSAPVTVGTACAMTLGCWALAGPNGQKPTGGQADGTGAPQVGCVSCCGGCRVLTSTEDGHMTGKDSWGTVSTWYTHLHAAVPAPQRILAKSSEGSLMSADELVYSPSPSADTFRHPRLHLFH